MMQKTERGIPIRFLMYPYLPEQKQHVVEKADAGGQKRRYLYGIASGMKTDGTGERMTANCVKAMKAQADSGEILLYAGQHGVDHTDDIGRLTSSQITPGGDWVIESRLYDEGDGFDPGSKTLEKANKLWKQLNGLKPYRHPLKKGFSIEGFIPDGGILEMSETGQRVIDNVELDGVLVTPRPAYLPSVAQAVYKALDILEPEKVQAMKANLKNTFSELLLNEEREHNFYTQKFKLDELFQEILDKIMARGDQTRDRLNLAFNEYKDAMIQLLLEHEDLFRTPIDQPTSDLGTVALAKSHRVMIYKSILTALQALKYFKDSKQKGKKRGRNSKRSDRATGDDNS